MNYEERIKQVEQFNIWADSEGFDIRMSGETDHSDKETHCAFLGWMAVLKKLEGCVVVPVELSDEAADCLVSKLFEGFKDIFYSEHRDLSATEREKLRLRWSRTKAKTLQQDYKLLVEAARGGK